MNVGPSPTPVHPSTPLSCHLYFSLESFVGTHTNSALITTLQPRQEVCITFQHQQKRPRIQGYHVPHIMGALQALCIDHQDVMGMQSMSTTVNSLIGVEQLFAEKYFVFVVPAD